MFVLGLRKNNVRSGKA